MRAIKKKDRMLLGISPELIFQIKSSSGTARNVTMRVEAAERGPPDSDFGSQNRTNGPKLRWMRFPLVGTERIIYVSMGPGFDLQLGCGWAKVGEDMLFVFAFGRHTHTHQCGHVCPRVCIWHGLWQQVGPVGDPRCHILQVVSQLPFSNVSNKRSNSSPKQANSCEFRCVESTFGTNGQLSPKLRAACRQGWDEKRAPQTQLVDTILHEEMEEFPQGGFAG